MRTSSTSVTAATAAPTRVGTTSEPVAAGRLTAAATPTAAKTASAASPYASLRTASTPIPAAKATSRTTMPVTRASLSCVPKCAIANSLTGTGVRLIAVWPTATTGAPFGPVTAAVSSAIPSATAPVSRPTRPDVLITAPIRTCPRTGLAPSAFLTK